MFTGLIEAVGVVADLAPAAAGFRLRVRTALGRELTPGDSLAVNGCCLTVTAAAGGEVTADVGPETARVTTLGSFTAGRLVNLERPLRADGRFGGHFVQGHVDGTGRIVHVRADGDARWVSLECPGALAPYVVPKGSIAVDGISLTIAALADTRLEVMIVPFTWLHTNLPSLQVNDRVNLECDMIAKYVVNAVRSVRLQADQES
jgi:riboflavin synthase